MVRIAKLARLGSSAGITLLLLGCVIPAAVAQTGQNTVNCFDDARGTVHEMLVGDCKGRPVSDEEAASIREQRRDYIQKVLSRSPIPQVKGKRLVGLASGFFVAEDGSVVTNDHVVSGCAAVSVTPTFGEMQLAKAVVSDPQIDLALLRTDIAPPDVARLGASGGPAVVSVAYVAGYPNKGLVTNEPILAAVDVIGRESNTPKGPAIVLRGDIRHGNSGGPLLDTGGNVLGVVFAKVDSVNVYQTTGQVVREIGFALPGDVLEGFLTSKNVAFQVSNKASPQPQDRILEDARPFLVQVGCWK